MVQPNAAIIAIGSGRDSNIEAWWKLGDQRQLVARELRLLGIDLVTSPNYSLFTDQPRYEDMYNIKRIGIAWSEIALAGMPCALHINARTHRDYQRWAEFIREREEVVHLAVEFGTGAGWTGRLEFHVNALSILAMSVHRPLHLTMIGGIKALPRLSKLFSKISFVDTGSFVTAIKRQRVEETSDLKLAKRLEATGPGQPLDDLLAANVEVMSGRVQRSFLKPQPDLRSHRTDAKKPWRCAF